MPGMMVDAVRILCSKPQEGALSSGIVICDQTI